MENQNLQSNENNTKKNVNQIIQYLSDKSIVFLFLIFSFFLVVFAVKANAQEKYVMAAFFTLIYALIAQYVKVFRNFEPIKDYTAKSILNLFLFIGVMGSLLLWWMVGLTKILSVQSGRGTFNSIIIKEVVINDFFPILILIGIWVLHIMYLKYKDYVQYYKNIIINKVSRKKNNFADQEIEQNSVTNNNKISQ